MFSCLQVEAEAVSGGLSRAPAEMVFHHRLTSHQRNGHGKLPPLIAAPPGRQKAEERALASLAGPGKGLRGRARPCPLLESGCQEFWKLAHVACEETGAQRASMA